MSVDVNVIRQASAATTAVAGTTTAAGSFWGFLNEYGVALGLIVAVLGFIVNVYYNHKEDKRRQIEHDGLMKDLQE